MNLSIQWYQQRLSVALGWNLATMNKPKNSKVWR